MPKPDIVPHHYCYVPNPNLNQNLIHTIPLNMNLNPKQGSPLNQGLEFGLPKAHWYSEG